MPTPLSPRFDPNAPQHNEQWSALWTEKVTPWDRTEPSPALVELLEQKPELFECADVKLDRKRALIPGCGRGYDVALLSRVLNKDQFSEIIGLDVAAKAVEEAQAFLNKNSNGEIPWRMLQDDFFSPKEDMGQFALIYDYTFLCAMPPHRRGAWAQRMSELVAPGGLLVTLQHPLDEHEGGPPFSLSSGLYDELLLKSFEKIHFAKPGKSFQLETSKLDMMAVFRRRL